MLASKAFTQGGAGTTTIVPAVAGRPLYIKRLFCTISVTGTAQFQDTAGNALSGVLTLTAGTPLVLPDRGEGSSPDGWFEPAVGLGLQIVSTTGAVAGLVQYIQ